MPEKIAIAADHAGFALKSKIIPILNDMGFAALDLGTGGEESVDYPDFAEKTAQAIINGEAKRAIIICGSGVGISIAANRHRQIRAALCHNAEIAKLARKHNDANVLALGSRIIDEKTALECVEAFLKTDFEGGRHQNRVDKLS